MGSVEDVEKLMDRLKDLQDNVDVIIREGYDR